MCPAATTFGIPAQSSHVVGMKGAKAILVRRGDGEERKDEREVLRQITK